MTSRQATGRSCSVCLASDGCLAAGRQPPRGYVGCILLKCGLSITLNAHLLTGTFVESSLLLRIPACDITPHLASCASGLPSISSPSAQLLDPADQLSRMLRGLHLPPGEDRSFLSIMEAPVQSDLKDIKSQVVSDKNGALLVGSRAS